MAAADGAGLVRDGLLSPWLGLALAWVAGSFPSAYLAGRLRGVDLRTVGSGNLGATNVLRTFGWRWAAPVFAADALKGFLPVAVLPYVIETARSDWWAVAYGAAAIAGHTRPIFLLGRGGGKGVATGAGVFLALAPAAVGLATAVFAVAVGATGYVSLGSLLAATTLPLAVAAMLGVRHVAFVPSVAICAFVWWTHRANVGRLRRGEEPSFKRRRPSPPGDAA